MGGPYSPSLCCLLLRALAGPEAPGALVLVCRDTDTNIDTDTEIEMHMEIQIQTEV